jgi:uncharacterized pyridoxal phosphate-containing UPF0001 family protein
VHGVDRLIIAERLSSQRLDSAEPLNICLQVNIDGQDSKDGCVLKRLQIGRADQPASAFALTWFDGDSCTE